MEMKDEFLFKTHMLDKNGEKTGVNQIADYMFRADMIYRMKLAVDIKNRNTTADVIFRTF